MTIYLATLSITQLLFFTLFIGLSGRRRARHRQRLRSRLLQQRVNCNEQPLLYTIEWAANGRDSASATS